MPFDAADDLAAFFDATVFGAECLRHRTGATPVALVAIIGAESKDYFEGSFKLRAQHRVALFPASHDVRRGDSLEVLTGSFVGTYRVEDIERRNDGAEAVATLIV
jgi:hypothetical protein